MKKHITKITKTNSKIPIQTENLKKANLNMNKYSNSILIIQN